MMRAAKLILGSGSSSRRLVLAEMGFPDITVITADIDERSIGDRSHANGAENLVKLLAHQKADAILTKIGPTIEDFRDYILITTDQVITYEGAVLEKPLNAAEARAFLTGYSYNCCSTVGSIVLTRLKDGQRTEGVDISTIHFKDIPPAAIDALIEEGDVFYSAGALLVENPLLDPCIAHIDGSMDGVLGLSKTLLERLLEELSKSSIPLPTLQLSSEIC